MDWIKSLNKLVSQQVQAGTSLNRVELGARLGYSSKSRPLAYNKKYNKNSKQYALIQQDEAGSCNGACTEHLRLR